MRMHLSALQLVILACLSSSSLAGNINLQNGNLLLVSENVLVQVDRTGDVVDGVFLPVHNSIDVALDSNGQILVAGFGFQGPPIIYRIETNGVVLDSNAPPVGFESFAVTPNGEFLLGSGTTMFRVDSNFSFEDAFPVPPAPGSAPYISGVSMDQNGNIYVAAWSQNGRMSVIHKMDAEGNVLETFGPYEFEIVGLTVDTNKHIFYAKEGRDPAGFPLPSTIVELDVNGIELGSFQSPFQVDGITLIRLTPAPRLLIGCARNQVVIRWPARSIGFRLQAASISSLHNWSDVSATPIVVDSFFAVTVSADDPGKIFRLQKSSGQ